MTGAVSGWRLQVFGSTVSTIVGGCPIQRKRRAEIGECDTSDELVRAKAIGRATAAAVPQWLLRMNAVGVCSRSRPVRRAASACELLPLLT